MKTDPTFLSVLLTYVTSYMRHDIPLEVQFVYLDFLYGLMTAMNTENMREDYSFSSRFRQQPEKTGKEIIIFPKQY